MLYTNLQQSGMVSLQIWYQIKRVISVKYLIAYFRTSFINDLRLSSKCLQFNTLRLRPNGCHLADVIFKSIFLNENVWILIKISLKFVPKGRINNIPALIEIMAWRRPGDKPLSEPMLVSLPTHTCVTRPQWVNWQKMFCGFIAWFIQSTSQHPFPEFESG